jgi:hypothetical protein
MLITVFIYPAKQAPHYKIGYKAALAFCLASMTMTGVFKLFVMREERRLRAAEERETEEAELAYSSNAVEDVDEKAGDSESSEKVLGYR